MTKRVMIVDDDKEFLEELQESLVLDEYEVITVTDPKTALQTAMETRPDVVLLDITMPEESGFQVACEIKYFSGLKDTSIIAMTGFFKERYATLMKGYGFKGFLKKPFDHLDLICKIEEN